MQFYSGPTRRAIRKLKTNTTSSFTVDGIINHEEERAVYVRQKFTIRQYENQLNAVGDGHNNNYMSDNWVFEEEKGEFDARVGNQVDNLGVLLPSPFTKKHSLVDRLLLNKTFNSLTFKPDNAQNYLEIENQPQIQLAPLLCSEKQFENVTHPPIVSEGSMFDISNTVEVDFSMYGRYWIGTLHDMAAAAIANRNELAPYFMDAMDAPVAAGFGNNFERFSAYGFTLNQLPPGQKFRPYPFLKELGMDAATLVQFHYDENRNFYESEEFTIKVPWPLNNGTIAGHAVDGYREFVVPSVRTRSCQGNTVERKTDHITPFNYWKNKDLGLNDVENGPRLNFPTPAEIVLAGVRLEERNGSDFFAIPIDFGSVEIITGYAAVADAGAVPPVLVGDKIFPAAGAGSKAENKQIYMFVPAFRIVKGNKFKSLARPRRYAPTTALVVANPWSPERAMSALGGGGIDLLSQVPFWANFEDSRYLQQHISDAEIKTLYQHVYSKPMVGEPSLSDREYGYEIWEHKKVATFVLETDALHLPLVCLQFEENLPAAMEAQVQIIKTAVVDNRVDGVGALQAALKEVVFLFAEKVQSEKEQDGYQVRTKGYFRLRLDECNTFKNGAGLFEGEDYDTLAGGDPTIVGGVNQEFRENLWNNSRRIQVEILPALGGFTLDKNVSPFRNESLIINAERLDAGQPRVNALVAANITPASELGGKPLDMRSVFNFMNSAIEGAAFTTDLPQAAGNGLLSTVGVPFSNFDKYNKPMMELFIPRRREVANHFTGAKEVTVECIEPFFGYCTGSSQLECVHPMDTRKHGKNFPISIQDYQYTYARNASPIVDQLRGYIKDSWTNLVITSDDDPEFTSISEKLVNVRQENKDLMRIDEVTSTFDAYQTEYAPGVEAEINIETRSGMFEYIFLFCKYKRAATDTQSPYNEPVVTKLRFNVRGRQNMFVRVLDQYDIERLSRQNCHSLCKWRDLHEKGQGVLLHLGDIGLTEEIAYPKRKRIQLKITLLSDTTEKSKIIHEIRSDQRIFNAVLIRQNQRMSGDKMGCRFAFLNES